MSNNNSVMDLSILHRFLLRKKLKFKIAKERTRGDGNCFLYSLWQNMIFYSERGEWLKDIPRDINDFRAEIINYMINNKDQYIKDGPMTEEQFDSLILDQSRKFAWTDEDGYFVLGAAQFLDVEIQIVVTSIDTPVIPSGVGGPLQKLNRGNGDKLKFSMGLIRNDVGAGHYQFILEDPSGESEEFVPPTTEFPPPPTSQMVADPCNSVMSPVKLTRSRIIINYLKSPSPKKQYKTSNCQFCPVETKSAEMLEHHLKSSELCKKSYMRNFKTSRLEPILVTQFCCMFCDVSRTKFTVHLRKNPRCQNKYFLRFQVNSLQDLMKTLEGFKRQLRESRSKSSRRLENQLQYNRKSEIESGKSQSDILNRFSYESTFFNVKICFLCKANVINADVINADEMDPVDDEEDLNLNRRFQMFWRCRNCQNNDKIDTHTTVQIQMVEEDDKKIFVHSPLLNDQNSQDFLPSSPHVSSNYPLTCMFPASLDALDYVDTSVVKPRGDAVSVMYRLNPDVKQVISLSLENELFKYKRAKMFSDRYSGILKDDGNTRSLASAEKVSNDFVIVASDSYHRVENQVMKHRFEQFGLLCYSMSVSMDVSDDILASCLIQNGLTVSASYIGSSSGELETVFHIHNHYSDQDCGEECRKETLETYLSESDLRDEDIKAKYTATYLSSVQVKMQSFVKNFIKDCASEIYSENFTFKLIFHLDGSVTIDGYFWPTKLDEMNTEISKYPNSKADQEIQSRCIKYIDSTVSNSSNAKTLELQFNLSQIESQVLEKLVKTFQHHHCEANHCDKCENPRLPAIETDFSTYPDPQFSANISSASQFRKMLLIKLKSVNGPALYSLTTEEWIRKLFENSELLDDETNLKLKVENQEYTLLKDDRLVQLLTKLEPVLAFYQYCITCVNRNQAFRIVLVTKMLADSFTVPFNMLVLKAFKTAVEIAPVNGYKKEFLKVVERSGKFDQDSERFSEGLKMTHREISITEVFHLLDRNLLRSWNSTSHEFLNCVPERKMYFKKVSSESETTFTVDGMRGFFEKQTSVFDKYFDRVNGKEITLAEFCIYYDFSGSEDSRQIIKLLKKTQTEIKESQVLSAYSKERCLPELVITGKGEVMKLRSVQKVLSYPSFEDNNFKSNYCKVVLFLPLLKDPVQEEEVQTLFNKCDDPPILDGNGNKMTIVQRVERYMLFNHCFFLFVIVLFRALFRKKNFSFHEITEF